MGSELLTNGDAELDANWTSFGLTTNEQSTEQVHGGTYSRKAVMDGVDDYLYNTVTLTNHTWYLMDYWAYISAITQTGIHSSFTELNIPSAPTYNTTGSWLNKVHSGRATEAGGAKRYKIGGPGTGSGTGTFYIDDASFKPLTLSSLFSSVSTSDADVIADAGVTLTAGTQAGLVLNLNDTTTSTDFILVYHNGTQVIVDQAVAGVYTNKQTTTVTYSAGATLRAIREGTKLRVYYNNALVGAELTMTANTNTKHGLFSTYASNSFDNFTLWARGTGAEYVNLPDTDLTATRDTSVYYSGSSSLKLVAGTSDNGYTQAYTLPDTSNYTLSAFVYTDGSAVTASDLSLENGDVNLATTYTSVGNGWYKLSASFTGVASSRNYGVKVKAGRTVYVDNLSLFATSGSGNTLAIGNSTTGLG